MNIREEIEADLADTLEDYEDGYGLPVILINDTGDTQVYSANDPTKLLAGQILYDSRAMNPDTGAEVIDHKPVVTLRRTSLNMIPQENEKWIVKIPITPSRTAPVEDYTIERPSEDGGAIGFIRLYLIKVVQS